jgi:hypothetical protein
MRLTLTGFAFAISTGLIAQTVTIKQVQLAGEKVIVTYDLDDSNPNNDYLLNLYASKDNFATPLTNVSGDVGMDIKPGVNKKIEWSIMKEYGGYKGKLSLEVRGKVYVPFVRLQGFDAKQKYKVGKSYDVKWKPGSSNPIIVELYKGGQRISGDVNQPNNGHYTLFIPGHAKKGSDYYLKITDSKNSDEVINTAKFAVASKMPAAVKFGIPAVIVVGGIVYFLTQGGKNPTNDQTIEDPAFPQ